MQLKSIEEKKETDGPESDNNSDNNNNPVQSNSSQLGQLLAELNADIVCMQETRISDDQLEDALVHIDGWESFWSHSAVKKVRML